MFPQAQIYPHCINCESWRVSIVEVLQPHCVPICRTTRLQHQENNCSTISGLPAGSENEAHAGSIGNSLKPRLTDLKARERRDLIFLRRQRGMLHRILQFHRYCVQAAASRYNTSAKFLAKFCPQLLKPSK